MKSSLLFNAFLLCLFVGVCETKGVVITCQESGPNVVCTVSGSANLTGLGFGGPIGEPSRLINPSLPSIVLGSGGLEIYSGMSSVNTFGSGTDTIASSFAGDAVGFSGSSLTLPIGYVTGASLSGTATWNTTSFATLGITLGTHTGTWGAGPNQRLTLNVVPEPTALLCLSAAGLCVGGFATSRRYQLRTR